MEKLAPPNPGDAYSYGWKILKNNFMELLFLVAVMIFIQSPLGYFQREVATFSWDELDGIVNNGIYNLYSTLYWILIAIPLQFGAAYLFLKTARGEPFEMKVIISPYNRIVDVILAQVLSVVFIMIGLVFFIIPGIIVLIRLSFVKYLVMDKGLDAMGAVKESWRMTSGYSWTIIGMAIIAVFVFIGGMLAFIVGVIVAFMWINIAFASLYYAVDSKLHPVPETTE